MERDVIKFSKRLKRRDLFENIEGEKRHIGKVFEISDILNILEQLTVQTNL